jgi:Holliday junction DNA helicase RuvA
MGRVVGEDAVGVILLDVGGVGYEVHCPIGTARRASTGSAHTGSAHAGSAHVGQAVGTDIIVYVHTNVRQDALELFGFATLEDRETFRKLITVPNVGPRLALSVLHVLDAPQLAAAIDAGDRALLERVPGVGKKTAERLVLELRGKLDAGMAKAAPTGPIVGLPPKSRLVSALTGLGYRPQEAERAARAVEESGAEGEFSSLLRLALKHLAP